MKSQNAILIEDEKKRRKEFATILAFDVKALPEADLYAKKCGVHIIHAEIIYHLCDQYKLWMTKCQNERKEQQKRDAVFPCILKPIAYFNKKDPIVIGCDVAEGVLKLHTPICVFKDSTVGLSNLETSIGHRRVYREQPQANPAGQAIYRKHRRQDQGFEGHKLYCWSNF